MRFKMIWAVLGLALFAVGMILFTREPFLGVIPCGIGVLFFLRGAKRFLG